MEIFVAALIREDRTRTQITLNSPLISSFSSPKALVDSGGGGGGNDGNDGSGCNDDAIR